MTKRITAVTVRGITYRRSSYGRCGMCRRLRVLFYVEAVPSGEACPRCIESLAAVQGWLRRS